MPRATRFGLVSTSTIQFDPIGWRGAKLDLLIEATQTSVRDPLTARNRPISGTQDRSVELALRDDIRATFGNVLNARHHFNRTVYDGRRERDPILFVQKSNQLIGPIFSLSIKGGF